MIKVEGVYKSYKLPNGKRHHVYRDLWLTLPGKTNIGIVGRNGAGKSTLVRLLSKMDQPDQGRITCEGLISPPIGLQSGFLPQLSGRDSARFICRIRGDDYKTQAARVEYIRALADIGPFFDQPTQSYSTGMRARLAFAISMAYDYEYYLIDELTGVGDESFRLRSDAIFQSKRGRSSIILISHSLETLRQWCDVGLYVHNGTVKYFNDINQAITEYKKETA
ncbi:capsular polysaccharide transport system ATP-binding protein [Hydrocarboniphaga daqingensis]|jgi:capsular polysaccharide transport system ATP-binding protein|uniref:Capsular polysaccharide transport system ATP-binding protein n=1 Tax=Hydrocarboniphaga daqingensis TaxID=490188 RepID=A0A1M5N5W6_9GAMM|nr:ABC transporter ATP-binding protein [Hydrocarboniphaga daqingensis]SHG84954.1 capsular polysaccharide transport system ATP-binding protein [Hydrocarboniphaga daqingensis]